MIVNAQLMLYKFLEKIIVNVILVIIKKCLFIMKLFIDYYLYVILAFRTVKNVQTAKYVYYANQHFIYKIIYAKLIAKVNFIQTIQIEFAKVVIIHVKHVQGVTLVIVLHAVIIYFLLLAINVKLVVKQTKNIQKIFNANSVTQTVKRVMDLTLIIV